MSFWSSVRWRLLLAFLGISSFAVLIGAVAIYAFLQIETVLERITEHSVPSVLASLRLSRQAERLMAAAPALLAATDPVQHEERAARIRAEIAQLAAILDNLRRHDVNPAVIEPIEFAANWLTLNLISMETTVGNALAIGEQRVALHQEALAASTGMRLALQPTVNRLDDRIANADKNSPVSESELRAQREDLARQAPTIAQSWPIMRMHSEVASLGDRLAMVAAIDEQATLDALGRQLVESSDRIETLAKTLEGSLRAAVTDHTVRFRAYLDGPKSVVRARALELGARDNARRLLAESTKASDRLTRAVDLLVAGAERDIREAGSRARYEQRVSTIVIAAVLVLSLATSVLIVWLYVDRRLIRRLTMLSNSMLTISRGNLNAAIPTGGRDEIGHMANALTVFRATSAERAETAALIPGFAGRPVGELILKGKSNEIGAFEPVGEDEARSERLASYLSAFEKLTNGDPGCLQAFARYVGTYGNESLASFHLQRLLGGQISTKILLSGD